jgi:predicted nucleic acid-binding protein
VIYLDTSVALAHLLAEDRRPPDSLWRQPLAASRLLEYELWTRLNARRLGASHGELARRLVERLAILELLPNVLARALEPFPAPVRTLDALHLASIEFLRGRGQAVELASYDERLIVAASALGIPLAPLSPASSG